MVHQPLSGYSLIFSHDAEKTLNRLKISDATLITNKIKKLFSNLSGLDIKKLKSTKYNLYRLRVGSFRVVYAIQNNKIAIYIIAICPQKDIYKKITRMLDL